MSAAQIAEILNKTFGITLDDVNGQKLDYARKKPRQCEYCQSQKFESRLAEPETLESIDVPLITHNNWNMLDESEKVRQIEKELAHNGLI